MADWTKEQPIHRIIRCEKVNWANQMIRSRVSAMESHGKHDKNVENGLSSTLPNSHVI